ncbi:hypothetical protein DWB61_07690 [Ancylomarina euxinus]|uniref:Transposase IS200-like domain-containing protein n=1 Tax=Ancylomarina euxinus TaxID=2283627 RepID=A0A425Y2S8_9BACT|nr:transposase [Ancylomarina euxinus]MCZ4694875.1 hypothetical protein [Ancylomarina euxinus]MUP14741.1 hypothetical protein [Ancylomarina euxinus]RRG22088.1 hypothetical protein DWB61_07690 [Ancylomarina euxinus]
MSEKYKGQYRIESARLKSWDYASSGIYFITICTDNRQHYFGEVENGKMQLSKIGVIAEEQWLKTFQIREDMNLEMDEFVIMPNHFHAIIIIGENKYNAIDRDTMHQVETQCIASVQKNNFGAQSKNLASIIRGFKIGVTKNARIINPEFTWQARFYDHIIRNDESLSRIRDYIKSNPLKWAKDKFYE